MSVKEDCWAHVLCWRGSGWPIVSSVVRHSSANDGRFGGIKRLRSLRRMNASSLCRSVALVKPHQALEAHVSVAITKQLKVKRISSQVTTDEAVVYEVKTKQIALVNLNCTTLAPSYIYFGERFSFSFSLVQLSSVEFSWVQFSSVQFSWVQLSPVQFSSVQFSWVEFSCVEFSSVQFSSVQFSSVQFSSVQFNLAFSFLGWLVSGGGKHHGLSEAF